MLAKRMNILCRAGVELEFLPRDVPLTSEINPIKPKVCVFYCDATLV